MNGKPNVPLKTDTSSKPKPKVDRKEGRGGVNILDASDGRDGLTLSDVRGVGNGPIPESIRKAIIIDKCQGEPTRLVALKYQVGEETVRSIYNGFMVQANHVRHLADQGPEEFKSTIRRKAVMAIESGLDCDRDPYRQAAVGINVMKGIGEFKSDNQGATVTINNMIANVPSDWKGRYIGVGSNKGGQE